MFKMYEHYSGSGFHLDITSIYYLLTSVLLKGHMPAFCEVNIQPSECVSVFKTFMYFKMHKKEEKIQFMARQ